MKKPKQIASRNYSVGERNFWVRLSSQNRKSIADRTNSSSELLEIVSIRLYRHKIQSIFQKSHKSSV